MVGVRAGVEVAASPGSLSGPCINEPRPHRPPIYSEKRDCHSRWRHASGDLLRSGLCVARSISARRENNSDRRVVARSTRKVAALEAGARSQTLGRFPRRIHDLPIEATKLRFRHASRVNRLAIASGLSSGRSLWCAPVGLPCSTHPQHAVLDEIEAYFSRARRETRPSGQPPLPPTRAYCGCLRANECIARCTATKCARLSQPSR
jgi:hypothetical protein